jgi:aryl-alcohol dehydrogenase-like predicted oxidoreductase
MINGPLGNSGLEVSPIGLGTWAFNSRIYGKVDNNESVRTIRAALDLGVTFFDTAPLYGVGKEDGVAERILGQGLGADRDRVIISTKFGRNPSLEGTHFNGKRARESVDESLERLGTDRIDLLFFHSPFGPHEIDDDVWADLADLKQAGKIRAVGHSISLFQDTQGMARQWALERKIDAIQVVFSLMNREALPLIHDLGAAGIGIVARECLANGFLSGTITADTVFPEGSLNARYSREEITERARYAEALKEVLVRDDVTTLPQAALRWALDQGHVSLALTGAKNVHELRDCVLAAEAKAYSEKEIRKTETLHKKDYSAA